MHEINGVIVPLICQHAADAAFYWQQVADSRFSILQSREDIKEFCHYLDAHLNC